MPSDATLAIGILISMSIGFIVDRWAPAVIALIGAAAFLCLGLVSTEEAVAAMANQATLTIACMFVLSSALVRTGMLEDLAGTTLRLSEDRPRSALALLFVLAFVASGFLSNTAVVLVMIPLVTRVAASVGVAANRVLLPLSYVAILGGTCTLLGTSTSLLIDGIARSHGVAPLGIFDVTPFGLAAAITGVLFLTLFGRRLLPSRATDVARNDVGASYLTEAVLRPGSSAVSKELSTAEDFRRDGVILRGVRRGTQLERNEFDTWVLEKGDAVLLSASASELMTLNEQSGLEVGFRRGLGNQQGGTVVEVVVGARSAGAGKLLPDLGLSGRFGIAVLGVHRDGHTPGPTLAGTRLRPVDRLLLQGPPEGLARLLEEGDFVSVGAPVARPYRRRRANVAILALASVVVLAALGVMPVAGLAFSAVALILALRCIDVEEAWAAIDGSVLLLISAMLIVGRGLESTEVVHAGVMAVEPLLRSMPPYVALLCIYGITSILTEIVSNAAVAVVMTPLAVALAPQLDLSPRSLVMCVLFGASASFATPIGYQTNTLVHAAGGYSFRDFLKVGVPMNTVVALSTTLAIWAGEHLLWSK